MTKEFKHEEFEDEMIAKLFAELLGMNYAVIEDKENIIDPMIEKAVDRYMDKKTRHIRIRSKPTG